MKILFATIGSFGDVNPYLALAKELKRRGHSPTVATASYFRQAVEKEGIAFVPIRPEGSLDDVELVKRVLDPKRGSERIVRELVMPSVRDMYADLEESAANSDLLVSHMLTYSVPLLAEKMNKRWISTVLAPLIFMSRYDIPVFPPMPWLASVMRPLGSTMNGAFLSLIKTVSASWSKPLYDFRRDLGLPPGKDPLWEGQHSPHGVLALFSQYFAPPQSDWPPRTLACGFPFLDEDDGTDEDPERPIVFTLGSSAVMTAGNFYEQAAEAAHRLNQHAVLVAGPQAEKLKASLPPTIRAVSWASFPSLFRSASVIVHPGGIGTTAQALRGGRPQLVIPFANDQFDNADHVRRLGAGETLYRSRVSVERLVESLRPLLEEASYREKASRLGDLVRREEGVKTACDQIEKNLV